MRELQFVRALYRPVQPTVHFGAGDDVVYREYAPAEPLLPFIYCYWELKTTRPLSKPFMYRVVADGCIDIFFSVTSVIESFVMGFCRKYTEFPLSNSFHYVGIRFLPSMFSQFFHVDASTLSDRYIPFDEIDRNVSDRISQRCNGRLDPSQIVKELDLIFLHLLSSIKFRLDTRFYGSLELVLRNFGSVDTESDLNTGLSTRQTRRVYNYFLGTSPKTFSRVIRFQNILNAKPSTQSLRKSKIFYDVGFYDQAHFIKDFKNFYGVTPSKAFR